MSQETKTMPGVDILLTTHDWNCQLPRADGDTEVEIQVGVDMHLIIIQ